MVLTLRDFKNGTQLLLLYCSKLRAQVSALIVAKPAGKPIKLAEASHSSSARSQSSLSLVVGCSFALMQTGSLAVSLAGENI